MSEDDAVVGLAREAGLEVDWTCARGTRRTVGIETLRAVLAALDLPADSRSVIDDSRARLRQEKERNPPLIIARAGETVAVDGEKFAEIEGEDGTAGTFRLKPRNGRASFRAPREPGYYRIRSGGNETALAVAPARALLPEDIAGRQRLAGVSVQIYSLRGGTSGGFGDFAALGRFARAAGGTGFDAVMASPTHAQFGAEPGRVSPYSPSTRLFLNPLFADATLAGGPKLAEPNGENSLIDWPIAAAKKERALRQAFAAFRRAGSRGPFESFCREGGERLLAHALFEALDAQFRGQGVCGFRNWPAGFESPAAPDLASFAKDHRRAVEYQLFLQWLAARSAKAAQKKALGTMAIGIIADLAVGMDPQGSHAWSAPQELLRGLHVGAPPDIFNAAGQDWGLTALSPRALRAHGFVPFVTTLRAAMAHSGGVRIDHALGLRRLWVVPAGASPAEGAYIAYPERAMLRLIALESHRHRAVVVGEDLGTVPEGFRADLAHAGVLGMQVLWFGRNGSEFAQPSAWRREAMATTTTHDLPTAAGWWTERDIAWRKELGRPGSDETHEREERALDRARLWTALKAARCVTGERPPREHCEAAVAGALAYVGKTRCTIAFAPVEDIAADPEQPNLPGTVDGHPNWRRRMKKGDLFRDPAARKRIRTFLAARKKAVIPRATYRLQFRKEFAFADAIPLIPYFQRLGISHIYASPILAARKGSAHGYDVVDHARINPELGGEDAFRGLVAALREHGLGIVVDIVPNHMAVGAGNAWWMDVLEKGRASPHSRSFDIDWASPDPSLKDRVLVPILGKPFSQALADGEITLVRDENPGKIAVSYFDHRLPLRPEDAQALAASSLEQFRSPDAIAALLDRQHYRLAWWRAAGDLINWRRFFDINDLIALRVEDGAVFDAVHAKHLSLYREGLIDGFRIDHVDGLADPATYCRKLRERMNSARGERGYLAVEKILASAEELPREWDVDGTTGYDFMDDVSALLHEAAGAEPLAARWAAISGRPSDFETEERRARRERLEVKFRGAFEAAARAFFDARDPQARDMTLASIKRALLRLYAQLRIYRCYATGEDDSPATGALFSEGLERARYRAPENDSAALTHIADTLEGRASAPAETRRIAARRFNQLAASLAAKAGEDTAFYRYGRLLSRNEVGADPGQFAMEPAEFHARAQRRGAAPLLATATHDHKRGEDVRARLAVLSEIPDEWHAATERWFGLNARLRDPQLDPGDEYQLYQTLVGSWPLDLAFDDRAALSEFSERILGWRLKSLHEEKIHSSWGDPDARYDRASGVFVRRLLDPQCSVQFLRDLADFVQMIAPAAALNSLSQAVLKCTCPGVPDFYQGTEWWDLSMVDPDNRRPVDFPARVDAIASERPLTDLLAAWRSGFVKQRLIAELLRLRAENENGFAHGDYAPVRVEGARKENVVAFLRTAADLALLVAVPRLCARGCVESGTPLPGAEFWGDTELILPERHAGRGWRDAFALRGESSSLRCSALFACFPAAVLIGER